jgi:class 3 adenylate cyclase
MLCSLCHTENRDDRRFCSKCAAPLPIICPSCGFTNDPGDDFCGGCAQSLRVSTLPRKFRSPESYTPKHLAEKILTSHGALEGERKQVTVLFVDVSGFTSLSEKLDPEEVHGLMTRAFELMLGAVHRYEGTVNQFLGDGIMALFGAPLTHEDHAQRAVHAALDIRRALERYQAELQPRGIFFRARQGLNTGVVVVGSIGSDLRMDYTAIGDTTNTAARLQQMAPPGGIWVGDTTHRGAREAFEWKAVGPIAMKGKAEQIVVHEVVAERAVKSRFEMREQRGLTRFVGRDADLQLLVAAWATARQGQGQVVSVIGEAGIGKSRLLHEFKEHLTREGALYVEGSCFAYGGAMSYLPFLAIVKELFRLDGTDTETNAKRQIASHLANLQVEAGRVAPYVHNLLAFAADDERFSRLTPALLRQRTIEALATLLLAEATRHPWVLIVEDVHWVDNATEEVLTALTAAMAAVPLLLVLVYRPEYLRTGSVPGARVALDQLSPEQSQAMVQDLLGTATLPPELAQLIARNTDGNPFFVEELTRSLLESGDLVRTGTGYVARTSLTTLDLPTTVQGVLLARIDRLPEALKEVLQIASVIGRVFPHPLLAHVVPRELGLDAVLAELAALEFLHATASVQSRTYSFKHVLTQEAVYQTLLRPKREEFHERIGNALEALYPDGLEEHYEVLAYHYVRSGNKDKAVEYLDLSNRKAARANAMTEAKAYFDDAMK